MKFLQIFHDAENCFVGSTEILDLFDLRRRLFALLEDRCEAVLVDEANDPTHYLDCMSMPFEWRFYMHSVDETGSAFKPSRQDMEQFVDLGVTHIDPGLFLSFRRLRPSVSCYTRTRKTVVIR